MSERRSAFSSPSSYNSSPSSSSSPQITGILLHRQPHPTSTSNPTQTELSPLAFSLRVLGADLIFHSCKLLCQSITTTCIAQLLFHRWMDALAHLEANMNYPPSTQRSHSNNTTNADTNNIYENRNTHPDPDLCIVVCTCILVATKSQETFRRIKDIICAVQYIFMILVEGNSSAESTEIKEEEKFEENFKEYIAGSLSSKKRKRNHVAVSPSGAMNPRSTSNVLDTNMGISMNILVPNHHGTISQAWKSSIVRLERVILLQNKFRLPLPDDMALKYVLVYLNHLQSLVPVPASMVEVLPQPHGETRKQNQNLSRTNASGSETVEDRWRGMYQSSWNYCSDSHRTNACINYPAHVLAVSCIYRCLMVHWPEMGLSYDLTHRDLSAEVNNTKVPKWWELFGVSIHEIRGVNCVLDRLYGRFLPEHATSFGDLVRRKRESGGVEEEEEEEDKCDMTARLVAMIRRDKAEGEHSKV